GRGESTVQARSNFFSRAGVLHRPINSILLADAHLQSPVRANCGRASRARNSGTQECLSAISLRRLHPCQIERAPRTQRPLAVGMVRGDRGLAHVVQTSPERNSECHRSGRRGRRVSVDADTYWISFSSSRWLTLPVPSFGNSLTCLSS